MQIEHGLHQLCQAVVARGIERIVEILMKWIIYF